MTALIRIATTFSVVLLFAGTAWSEVFTGMYVGDGMTSLPITGIPFQPVVVIIKGDDTSGPGDVTSAVLVTSTMPVGLAKPLKGGQALLPNLVQSLDPNGFTVGGARGTNQLGVTFYYTAFAADTDMVVGTYTGNGGGQSITGFNFRPDYVIVAAENANHAVQRSYQDIDSWPFWTAGPLTNAVTGLDPDGFTVGSALQANESTRVFHYVAWNEVAGKMRTGWYFGDGINPHAITDVGFQPEYLIVKAIEQNENPIQRFAPMTGDQSLNFMNAMLSNRVVAFEPLGFRVGSHNDVNAATDAYIYVAFGNGSKPPLTVIESTNRITVRSSANFEMSFDTAAGGGIQEFLDLSSGETNTIDLAGGIAGLEALVFDAVDLSGVWHNTGSNDTGELVLLEATQTRSMVRQRAFYQDESGPNIATGIRGIGDYAIYGTGRMALEWERRVRGGGTTSNDEFGLTVHSEPTAPLSNWQGFSESGPLPQAGGNDDFIMFRINDVTFGVYTDFLHILAADHPNADSMVQFGDTGDRWDSAAWDASGPRPLVSERIDSLIYFKPSDFLDNNDPNVIRRRDDYRAPDPLNIAIGAGWNENPADGDFFNESEGAYTLDMDPVTGLRFDMDGAATTRFTPFFKIRQWRSLQEPARITLEGTVLTNGNQFQSDVKPFTAARLTDDLLWYSTLENAGAVITPSTGSSGTIAGGTTFVPASFGNGALFDAPGKNVTFPGAGNIDPTLGSFAVSLIPSFNHNDNAVHHFWVYYVDANNFISLQKRADNFLELEIRHAGASTMVQVDPTAYSWRAQDEIYLRASWDMSAALGLQARIFLNGVEPAHIDPVTAYGTALSSAGTNYVGANQAGTVSANAILDEVRIFTTHQIRAHGGLGPHPFEYLSTGAKNFTLALDALDASGRGEYLYFGSDTRFRGLNVSLAAAGIGSVDLNWEYWDGARWADLESVAGFVDETAHWTRNGSIYWAADPPGWSVWGGHVELFYVRVHLESGAYTTYPVEDRIMTDILLLQYCDDITQAAQTFDFDVAPNPNVTISSFVDQTFTVGHLSPPVVAATITITDISGTSVTAGDDIRVRIPAGFNMRWDPTVTSVSLTGTAVGKVLPDVVYEDLEKTVVLNVVTDFAPGEQIRIDNLELESFVAPSPPDSLELEITNDGSVAAVDDKLIEIFPSSTPVLSSEFNQVFTLLQAPAPAATMYVTEGLTNNINTTNEIIIRIPATFDMLWDTSITSATIGGTGMGNVATAVTYEPGDQGVIIDVTTNFLPGQYISIGGLGFAGFTTFEFADNLDLDVGTAIDTDDKTIEIDVVADVPFFTATAKDLQVALEWVTPEFGTCVNVRIARRLVGDPTPLVFDWFVDVPCGGSLQKHITTDIPPVNDQIYTYGAFVSDGGNFSDGQLLKARPFDTSGKVKWAYSTAAASMAPPGLRFSGGSATVYAVSNDNILHAIQGGAGGGTWPAGWTPYRLGGPAQARPPVVPFAVDTATNGAAFLGAQDGNVYAINADDGTEVWSENIATMVQAAPAGNFVFYDTMAKDLVLVGTRNSTGPNALVALNVDDGSPEWSFTNSSSGQGGDDKTIGIISGSVAVDYGTRRLFFASRQSTGGSNNTMWCIDFDSGSPTLIWARAIGNIDGSPVLWNGVVYVGTNAGNVYALDETTGADMWPPLALGDGAIKGFVFPQFGSDNRLVSTNSKVWSFADTGAARTVNPGWPVTNTDVPSPSIPTYVPGTNKILVGSSDGDLYQLNVVTPTPPLSITLGDGGGAVGVPTMDLLNLMVYVGTDQGVIYGVEFPLP